MTKLVSYVSGPRFVCHPSEKLERLVLGIAWREALSLFMKRRTSGVFNHCRGRGMKRQWRGELDSKWAW